MRREYANVFTRLAAIVIDGLLLIPFYLTFIVLPWLIRPNQSEIFDIVIPWLLIMTVIGLIWFGIWNTIYRMGKTGQSLGRKFLGIAVLDDQGRPIGFGRAFLRETIGRFLSGIVCYVGYLNAFWDDRRQMWHDKIANCYVYNVEENFSVPGSPQAGPGDNVAG